MSIRELLVWENPPGQWNHRTWECSDQFNADLDTWEGPLDQLYWSTDRSLRWYNNLNPEGGLYDLRTDMSLYSKPENDVPPEVRAIALLLL